MNGGGGKPDGPGNGAIDPVTLELIRHRLWAINDDQSKMAARLSGSFIVYDGYDFNGALVTPDGRGLVCGIYILHHGATIDHFVRHVLEEWDPAEIRDGDLFFTNDPWFGALHANDGIMVTPIFVDGQLVTWAGIVMHDNDVGSPVPGSFVPGATERFGEAPLFPPVKIGERFELRRDIERMYLRNSRVPELNSLNMRARLAALRFAHQRVTELAGEYGVDTVLAAEEAIIDYVGQVIGSRLEAMPDGSWSAIGYHDHDGVENGVYPIACRIEKRGARLTFDFEGTAEQVPGAINCAYPTLEGTVMGAVLSFLCHDLPWATGGLRSAVEILAEPGTLVNATSPAAVSMASVMGGLSTQDVVTHAFAEMLLCTEDGRAVAQASWCPGIGDVLMVAPQPGGEPSVGVVVDCFSGGGGARSFHDGIDSGGIFHSMASRCANAETVETRLPVLELWRRQLADGGGPGRFRGGVPVEFASIPHKLPASPVSITNVSSGVAVPAGRGLSGGLPGSPVRIQVVRGCDVPRQIAAGRLPVKLDDVDAGEIEIPEPKAHFFIDEGDLIIGSASGGGGYGDPLLRDPGAVADDVRHGLVGAAQARAAYGVVLVEGAVDEAATEAERGRIRELRRGGSAPASEILAADAAPLHPVADTIDAVQVDGHDVLRCQRCDRALGSYTADFRDQAAMRERPLAEVSDLNAFCSSDFVAREYSCPGCGTAVAVEVEPQAEKPGRHLRLGSR